MKEASLKEWLVQDLIDYLAKMSPNSKVHLLDADTSWTISKFAVQEDDNIVTFYPCEYKEMCQ